MRKKRLLWNSATSLILQVVTIIYGFVLPKIILRHYGSQVNGLINSISQFLGLITFLEFGVGAVVQSALYKPLADHDETEISKILRSAGKFFKRLAGFLFLYVIVLIFIYPLVVQTDYSFLYTATLFVAISLSSFAQYYFGLVNSLLLSADQRGYVEFLINIVTLVLNIILTLVLVRLDVSIQAVKISSSLVFLLRPIMLMLYVRSNYHIDRQIQYVEEPIKQKWNGIAQHVAAVVLNNTDTIVLSLFATLQDVSIYSVYNLVINGIKNVTVSLTRGVQSLIGELWSKKELDTLNNYFGWFEWVMHTTTTIIFGCSIFLIVPFVSVYTKGITDANYYQPLFGMLIVIAFAGTCYRLPYNIMILAAGHYKQTQSNYIIAAIMNIVISIITVKAYGMIGVAIGTLIALYYQIVWMAWYDSKNLIKWPFDSFLKQCVVDTVCITITAIVYQIISHNVENYFEWAVLAAKTVVIMIVTETVINYFINRQRFKVVKERIKDFSMKFRDRKQSDKETRQNEMKEA